MDRFRCDCTASTEAKTRDSSSPELDVSETSNTVCGINSPGSRSCRNVPSDDLLVGQQWYWAVRRADRPSFAGDAGEDQGTVDILASHKDTVEEVGILDQAEAAVVGEMRNTVNLDGPPCQGRH